MEPCDGSRKKFTLAKPKSRLTNRSKPGLNNEEIQKMMFSKINDDSDVECLDSEENRSARWEQFAKNKSIIEIEQEMDQKLSNMGISGLDAMPIEEKQQLLNVLEESKETAKSEQTLAYLENEVTIDDDDDDDFNLHRSKVISKSKSSHRISHLRECSKKVCCTDPICDNGESLDIATLKRRGVEVSKVKENNELPSVSTKYIAKRKPLAIVSSQSGTTTIKQFLEESFQFDPMFPYPDDEPMPMPEWRIHMQKKNWKSSIHYIPNDISDPIARRLFLQENLDEHQHILIEYAKSKAIASKAINNDPKWVIIPSMTEYENRLFYKTRKAKKANEESIVFENDEKRNNELEPGSSTTSKSEISSAQSRRKNEKIQVFGNIVNPSRLTRNKMKKVSERESRGGWTSKHARSSLSNPKLFDGRSSLLSNPFEETLPEAVHSTSQVENSQNQVPGGKKRKNISNAQSRQQSESDDESPQLDVLAINEGSKKSKADLQQNTFEESRMSDASQTHSPVY